MVGPRWRRKARRGGAASVPVQQVDQPGVPESITLGPGHTAFAGVRFVDDQAQTENEVNTTAFLVTPPGANGSIPGHDQWRGLGPVTPQRPNPFDLVAGRHIAGECPRSHRQVSSRVNEPNQS
jgi:Protein of unknown function (DUF4232)